MATKRSTYGSVEAPPPVAPLRRVLVPRLRGAFRNRWWDRATQLQTAPADVGVRGADVGVAHDDAALHRGAFGPEGHLARIAIDNAGATS